MSPFDRTWTDLRALRAKPPHLAATDADRAAVFRAALEQAEQLWQASQNVGVETSPLLMFYSLAQAGRAIVASKLADANWQDRSNGHGIKQAGTPAEKRSANIQLQPFEKFRVAINKSGLFIAVSDALGSANLATEATLQELIAATPTEHTNRLTDAFSTCPKPLRLLQECRPEKDFFRLEVKAYPPAGVVTTTPGPTGADLVDRQALARWWAGYPKLAHLPLADAWLAAAEPDQWEAGRTSVYVVWKDNWQGSYDALHDKRIGSGYFEPEKFDGVVLPAIGGNGTPAHPLIHWWGILYSFSMLRRYYPSVWVDMLNVDQDWHAVGIEEYLELETAVIPELVALALD